MKRSTTPCDVSAAKVTRCANVRRSILAVSVCSKVAGAALCVSSTTLTTVSELLPASRRRRRSVRAMLSAWQRFGKHQHIRRSDSPARRRASAASSASASPWRAAGFLKRPSTRSWYFAAMASRSAPIGSLRNSSNAKHTASRRRSSRPSAPIGNGLPQAVCRSTRRSWTPGGGRAAGPFALRLPTETEG